MYKMMYVYYVFLDHIEKLKNVIFIKYVKIYRIFMFLAMGDLERIMILIIVNQVDLKI